MDLQLLKKRWTDVEKPLWRTLMFLVALYSTFITPIETTFFDKLPILLKMSEIIQFLFLTVHARTQNKYWFIIASIIFFPWKVLEKPGVWKWLDLIFLLPRWISWVWITYGFFEFMKEGVSRLYRLHRFLKLILIYFHATHALACTMYYVSTFINAEDTWIGSLTLGNYDWKNYKKMGFWRRYSVSWYWSTMTFSTIGYGDIHAVNIPEMILIIISGLFMKYLLVYLLNGMSEILFPTPAPTPTILDQIKSMIQNLKENKPSTKVEEEELAVVSHSSGTSHIDERCSIFNAISDGNITKVRDLIKTGKVQVDETDYYGRTLLHRAILGGHESIARYLMKKGANLNIEDKFGATPLLDAILNDQLIVIANELLKHKANFKVESLYHRVCSAVIEEDVPVLRKIIELGLDPKEICIQNKNTFLHLAAHGGLCAVGELLGNATGEALIIKEDSCGRKPTDVALNHGYSDFIKILNSIKKEN